MLPLTLIQRNGQKKHLTLKKAEGLFLIAKMERFVANISFKFFKTITQFLLFLKESPIMTTFSFVGSIGFL